jgi:Fe-S oxidoreductase
MECGRCERLCPAFQTGQSLTPRQYLRDLREYVGQCEQPGELTGEEPVASATQAITPSSLWACRLCRACEELCPAEIEHVPQLAEIRRAEVLGHGRLPDEGAGTLRNLARTGNPYGASPVERASWIQEQRIPDHPPDTSGKALFLWTGCFQPGDEQKPRVLSCLVALLRELEVPFFIPQEPTSCCGDPARILGEEDLFQTMAREQAKRIEASGAERVLVHCPHCYTVLKDVYPLLGARFSVIHTSELFEDLIREKGLQSKGFPHTRSVVYHDPCFLGRYQEIVEPPRGILASLPGIELHDPPRSGKEGYCCGAGGGHFFMDLDLQERPSSQRLEEILAQEPDTLAVSCSFCFSMFDDALRRLPDPPPLRVADWLELVEEATVGEKG